MIQGLANLPTTDITRVLIDFTQWLFSKSDICPAEYRWDPDERKSLIRISKIFPFDDEKPLSSPYITFSRGAGQFQNRALDNLAKSNINDFSESQYIDLMPISVVITAGAKTSDESENLAAFALHGIHSNRNAIKKNISYIHSIKQRMVNNPNPKSSSSEIHCWETTAILDVVLKIGWLENVSVDAIKWDSMEIINAGEILGESDSGVIIQNGNIIKDLNMSFWLGENQNPNPEHPNIQFIQDDIDKNRYFISIDKQPYLVKEIVNENILRLGVSNEKGELIDFTFKEQLENVKYKIHWNKPCIRMVVPNKYADNS